MQQSVTHRRTQKKKTFSRFLLLCFKSIFVSLWLLLLSSLSLSLSLFYGTYLDGYAGRVRLVLACGEEIFAKIFESVQDATLDR